VHGGRRRRRKPGGCYRFGAQATGGRRHR
jgi:hypothetical protein